MGRRSLDKPEAISLGSGSVTGAGGRATRPRQQTETGVKSGRNGAEPPTFPNAAWLGHWIVGQTTRCRENGWTKPVSFDAAASERYAPTGEGKVSGMESAASPRAGAR